MRFACWVTKERIQTHSLYLILIACPLQQYAHECASVLRYTYTACLFKTSNKRQLLSINVLVFITKTSIRNSWFQTFAVFWMLYAFFWVIPRRLNFICRRFGTLCLFHRHRRVGMKNNWGWECWGIYTGKGLARNRWYMKFRRRGITQKKAYNKHKQVSNRHLLKGAQKNARKDQAGLIRDSNCVCDECIPRALQLNRFVCLWWWNVKCLQLELHIAVYLFPLTPITGRLNRSTLIMPYKTANEFTEAFNMYSGCRNASVLKALLLSKCKDKIRNCKFTPRLNIKTVTFTFLSDRERTLRN